MNIVLPIVKKGRRTRIYEQKYQEDLKSFCEKIIEIRSTLDFPVSSRGWCYLIEEYGLKKGDFDKAQTLINDWRRSGLLPLNICAKDITRTAEGIEDIDDDIETHASKWVDYLRNTVSTEYKPYYFTDYQNYYLELLVEKIDLIGIFRPICEKYHIPLANSKGWDDLNSRDSLMRRFKRWEDAGIRGVLLYCGDHDPGGFHISDTIRKNLSDLSGSVDWIPDNLIIDRFGLNFDFIQENNLTWIDNLETGSSLHLDDPNHKDFNKVYVQNYIKEFGSRKVEANALVTRVEEGRRLLEDAVLKYINLNGVDNYNKTTEEARKLLQEKINNLMK